MRIYWIDKLESGRIGMMARPKGNDWLLDEIISLKNQDVNIVISLLEPEEIDELELSNEGKYCEENHINYVNYPITDRGVPKNKNSFKTLVDKLILDLKENKTIVIHCRMGIGRTSVLASAILLDMGIPPVGLFDYLSEIRTLEVPDTEAQKEWVLDIKT